MISKVELMAALKECYKGHLIELEDMGVPVEVQYRIVL